MTRLTGAAFCACEFDPQAWAVAVPVLGLDGNALAALELQTRNRAQVRQLQPPLVIAARRLAREISTTSGATPFHLGPGPDLDLQPAPDLRTRRQRLPGSPSTGTHSNRMHQGCTAHTHSQAAAQDTPQADDKPLARTASRQSATANG
jgi:hypothetical protein